MIMTAEPVKVSRPISKHPWPASEDISPQEAEELRIADLSEGDRKYIFERGYKIKREIGEGQGATRRAYDAIRNVGNLELEGILKIPRKEEDIVSLNALINRSKKNLDLQEALISGKLRHPGIVRSLDSSQLEDGRTCNFEDKVGGWSLTTFLNRAGPIREMKRIRQVFEPVISALDYVHEGKFEVKREGYTLKSGILHRDVTPNNVIVLEAENGGAVLTDFQNAAFEADIKNLAIPTRGGTAYTHPVLLNALLTGDLARATRRMDVYSLGAVLYEALTGEKAFHYSVTEGKEGKDVKINGKIFCLGLKDGTENLETITKERHEANLRKALKVMKEKKVPRKLTNLVSDMLTLNEKREIYSMETVQKRFLEATDTTREGIRKNIGNYIKTALITTGICTGIAFGAYFGYTQSKLPAPSREPTLSDVMKSQSELRARSIGDFDTGNAIRNRNMEEDFQKYISEAERRRTEIEGNFEKDLELSATRSGIMVDLRLTSALIRSISLEDKKVELAGGDREVCTLVPREYVMANRGHHFDEKEDLDKFRGKMWMGRYVQECFNFGDTVEEVYAKALCSQKELDLAKAQTLRNLLMKGLRDKGWTGISGGGMIPVGEVSSAYEVKDIDYFAREDVTTKEVRGREIKESERIPGYADNLNPIKKRIIDRATALYLITDGNGKLDFKKYSSPIKYAQSSKPISGEDVK
jgi:serine/threonine protein kinase